MNEGWQIISKGAGQGIVLALDFEAVGRPEACFSDFVALFDSPLEMWAATQPPVAGVSLPASAYLQRWSHGLHDRDIRAVLGFCAGSVYAAALAELVGRWQTVRPAVVLLDPDPPTGTTLLRQFDNAMRGLASVASEGEISAARAATFPFRGAEDLPSLGGKLTSLYREASRPAFARIGLKPEYQEDLAASFGSLMSYLAAAGDLRVASGWSTATAVLSADPPGEPAGVAGVARLVRTDVAHADLLRSPVIARLVAELLP